MVMAHITGKLFRDLTKYQSHVYVSACQNFVTFHWANQGKILVRGFCGVARKLEPVHLGSHLDLAIWARQGKVLYVDWVLGLRF